MDYLIVGIVSYLMGSIPFGLILTKIFLNKDIREIGSGNIGATNALRTGNKFIGYSTLILDIAKAIIPVIFVKINHPDLIYIASLCAFLGHVFPIWLKFKGGKGVAVYVGNNYFSFNLNARNNFWVSCMGYLTLLMFTNYSSLSSIIGSISIPVCILIYSVFLSNLPIKLIFGIITISDHAIYS